MQWLLLVAMAGLLVSLLFALKTRSRTTAMRAIIESFDSPLLFYDDRHRLVFYTSGLVLFDRTALKRLGSQIERPQQDKELRGELEIDSNLYRYRSRLIEYTPGRLGTLVQLQYLSPKTAEK